MSKAAVAKSAVDKDGAQIVLTDVRVEEIFKECLADESEDQSNGQLIEGVVHSALC